MFSHRGLSDFQSWWTFRWKKEQPSWGNQRKKVDPQKRDFSDGSLKGSVYLRGTRSWFPCSAFFSARRKALSSLSPLPFPPTLSSFCDRMIKKKCPAPNLCAMDSIQSTSVNLFAPPAPRFPRGGCAHAVRFIVMVSVDFHFCLPSFMSLLFSLFLSLCFSAKV